MMEDFKRPDHTDFMTASELARIKFSGIRHNSITDFMELWVDGERKGDISSHNYVMYPERWAKIVSEAFALGNIEVQPIKGN